MLAESFLFGVLLLRMLVVLLWGASRLPYLSLAGTISCCQICVYSCRNCFLSCRFCLCSCRNFFSCRNCFFSYRNCLSCCQNCARPVLCVPVLSLGPRTLSGPSSLLCGLFSGCRVKCCDHCWGFYLAVQTCGEWFVVPVLRVLLSLCWRVLLPCVEGFLLLLGEGFAVPVVKGFVCMI